MRQRTVGIVGFAVGIMTGQLIIPSVFAGITGAATPGAIPLMWSGVVHVSILGAGFAMAGVATRVVRSQGRRLELGEVRESS